jgi:hypothetical protein
MIMLVDDAAVRQYVGDEEEEDRAELGPSSLRSFEGTRSFIAQNPRYWIFTL